MTLQAILSCVQASFGHFELNCDVWSLVRTNCQNLLGSEELERYRELYEENKNDENCQSRNLTQTTNSSMLTKVDMISMMILRKRQS